MRRVGTLRSLDASRLIFLHPQVLRKKCMQHPSRADTLAAIASVKSEIAALESESNESAATVEARMLS